MALDIVLVKEDLVTRLPSNGIESIETEKDFCLDIQTVAYDLGLTLIKTIDPYGVTLINQLQLDPLEKEINIMRGNPSINQRILDILQQAVDRARSLSCYILFVGD